MIETAKPPAEETTQQEINPALENLAVAHCNNVWERAFQAAMKRQSYQDVARIAASKAYRRAMPPLSGHRNICDFVACVGYAMLIGALPDDMPGKLLYAAQIALSGAARPSEGKAAFKEQAKEPSRESTPVQTGESQAA